MIELTDEMRTLIANSATDGVPMVMSSVDSDGQPFLAYYGTAQALGTDQVAIWVRNPDSAMFERIRNNPRVSFVYWNRQIRTLLQLHGRARIETDEAIRNTVFENSPEIERRLDPDRKGTAIVADLTLVRGSASGVRILMERDPA